MPFLRFTRDKRGYETTELVHTVRRQGRSRHRILYWFRTPPGVKVGRSALDEHAIRLIEEQNPDIEFDWPKILEVEPVTAAADEGKPKKQKRDKGERRRPIRAPEPSLEAPAEPSVESSDAVLQGEGAAVASPLVETAEDAIDGAGVEDEIAEALEQLAHPDIEETLEPPSIPVEHSLGREQLTRLRARYAELQARITERGGAPERIEALRGQAEPLNPDNWVTEDEIRKGIEDFEPRIRDLRAALGLRRRRRSRRRRAPNTTTDGAEGT